MSIEISVQVDTFFARACEGDKEAFSHLVKLRESALPRLVEHSRDSGLDENARNTAREAIWHIAARAWVDKDSAWLMEQFLDTLSHPTLGKGSMKIILGNEVHALPVLKAALDANHPESDNILRLIGIIVEAEAGRVPEAASLVTSIQRHLSSKESTASLAAWALYSFGEQAAPTAQALVPLLGKGNECRQYAEDVFEAIGSAAFPVLLNASQNHESGIVRENAGNLLARLQQPVIPPGVSSDLAKQVAKAMRPGASPQAVTPAGTSAGNSSPLKR